MKGNCVNFLNSDLFLTLLGTLPWQPILGKICIMTFIQHAGILQWIWISQFRFRCDKRHNFFVTFCAILDKIRPLTPKITQEVSVSFGTRQQKSTYHTKYLSKYWTELHQLFSICRIMYADYKTEVSFAVVEETLLWYGNRLTLRACLQTSKLTVFTPCSGISKQNATSFCRCTD